VRPSLLLGGSTPALSPEAAERLAADGAERDRIAGLRTVAHPTILEYQRARFLARKLYPKPFADLFGEELEGWCDLGHRFGTGARPAAVCAQIMADAREAGLA
jgi:hypothetical protein